MKKYIFIIVIVCLTVSINIAESFHARDIVEAARNQIGKTLRYDSSYQAIDYPNGDIPIDRGVCTDVIIRALRDAYNYDLQKAVHEDMKNNFSKYPQIWGLRRPDKNIDHRRVPNLQTFFERSGWSICLSNQISKFKAGDIVTCIVPPELPHIMIVSDCVNRKKIPLAIHNIGAGTREEDLLFEYRLTGHYRIKGID
ncbi:MAG: DUF1287 domain-containing protein [Desulfobacteraceae bacterium]|jgi:hypothetical protein